VDLGVAVGAGAVQGDASPRRGVKGGEGGHELGAAGAQGEEADAGAVQLAEPGAGGDLGVEHQQLGQLAGGRLPVAHERHDLAGLACLGEVGVGVDEIASHPVVGEEGEHRLGALGAAGHVVGLKGHIVAVVHDRVEVQVELAACSLPGCDHGRAEGGQQALVMRSGEPVGVGAQRGRLGQRLQAGEGGQGGVGGHVIDVGDATPPDGFERQQAQHAREGGNLAGAWEAGGRNRCGQVQGDQAGHQQQRPGIVGW
jgi:hypothetical protein